MTTIPNLPAGITVADAALRYAACGWYVLPVDPQTKHPGSLVGTAWQFKSSRNPATVARWWQQWPQASLALHTGRSGAAVLDLDAAGRFPVAQRPFLDVAAFQSTDLTDDARGHYAYACEPMRYGNSVAGLPGGWGEVRSGNSVIVVQPSPHTRKGGRYLWQRGMGKPLPPPPGELAACLRPPGASHGAADAGDVLDFLAGLPRSDDEWCPVIAKLLVPFPVGSGRYAEIGPRVFQLARLGEQGHLNAATALSELEGMLYAEVDANPNGWDPEDAWHRALASAVAAMLADPTKPEDKGCCGGNGRSDFWGLKPASGTPQVTVANTAAPAVATAQGTRDPSPGDPILDELAAQYAPVDWHAAFKNQPDAIDWLFEPILERGTVNALFAKPGTGKSLIAEEIAFRLAREGHAVVYVDDENRVTDLVERLRDMGAGPDDLAGLLMYSFAGLPPLDNPEGGRHLLALAVVNQASLVVLDTTSRMVAGRENDSDTFIQLYRCSLVPLKQRGITVLRLDHPGKDEDRGQRGSSAKDGDVDTVWKLSEVVTESVYRLERTKSRSGHGDPALTVQRLRNPLRHSWSPGELSGVNELAKRINDLALPPNAGRPAVREALAAAGVRISNAQLTAAIRVRKQLSGTAADSADSGATAADCPSVPLIGTDRRTAPVPDKDSPRGRSSGEPGGLNPGQRARLCELTCDRGCLHPDDCGRDGGAQ